MSHPSLWSIADVGVSRFLINDTYRTDVHLLYPPYIIALAVLYIGFCLTAMNNPSGTRTRSSSSQINTLASSLSVNTDLNLPPPPASAAEFLASFEFSLPVLLACVQDIIVLYPVWESFEPSNAAARQGRGPITLAGATAVAAGPGTAPVKAEGDGKEKFGAEMAEALLRRMIEERMVDAGHPDDAGRADEKDGNDFGQIAGKKRNRP
jgi:cyclin C